MGAWGAGGDSGEGDSSHSNASPAGTPQPGQAQPLGPPASATLHWGHLGTGGDGLCHPRSAPTPRAGVWPCRGDAAPAPAAIPPAPRLRCQPGARLLFPHAAPALVAHDFFMPGWLCPRRGVPRPPEPRHPSRARPAAVTDPRNGAGSAFGPRRGGNKWVRVLGGRGWRGARVVGARRHLPGSAAGSGIYTSRPPLGPPAGSGSPRGGPGRCPTGTACPCVPPGWRQPDPSPLRAAETGHARDNPSGQSTAGGWGG